MRCFTAVKYECNLQLQYECNEFRSLMNARLFPDGGDYKHDYFHRRLCKNPFTDRLEDADLSRKRTSPYWAFPSPPSVAVSGNPKIVLSAKKTTTRNFGNLWANFQIGFTMAFRRSEDFWRVLISKPHAALSQLVEQQHRTSKNGEDITDVHRPLNI